MSRYVGKNNIAGPILEAAEHWKQNSLLSDKGIFEDKEIWKLDYFEELDQYLIKQLDKNNDKFLEKLETPLEARPPEIKQLAAEIWWLMFLCADKYKIQKKREDIKTIWKRSGQTFPENSKWLEDAVLAGIGHIGAGIFSRLAWEWEFFVLLMIELKKLSITKRKELLLSDGWKFAKWVEQIPGSATRQSRHMILFLLFPDNFERIFSTDHRKKIVNKFKGRETDRRLSAVEIDLHLLELRREKEKEHGTSELDFYNPPLNEWQNENMEEPKETDRKIGKNSSTKKMSGDTMNLILYGPPGTGKTYWLNNRTEEYSGKKQIPSAETLSRKQDQTRENWLRQEFESSDPQWLSIIIGVLYLETTATLTEISEHEYVRIKKLMTNNNNIRNSISTYLREHAAENSEVVQATKYDRPPFVFDQDSNKRWYLVNDWEEKCREDDKWSRHVELAKKWKAGPNQEISDKRSEGKPDHELYDRRFEFVTFHQAYGYEDFVEGIRPVMDKETGNVKYEVVPGVFKRICRRAKADPNQRYAIFIDEINRGNIASIFGELITLLETDKRVIYGEDGSPESGMMLTLPYSGERFGVPANLDIYGTMNTADRSIALLDTALRRRFQFQELMPDSSVINGSSDGFIEDGTGGTINLRTLLEAINSRICFLRSRDMTIGHSYLINVRNFDELKDVLLSRIIPLLQEYFYDDWHRIQLVFRDVKTGGEKPEAREPQIIKHKILDEFEDSIEYRVAPEDEITPDAIRKIYEESN